MTSVSDRRAAVVAEALTWIGTPFHHAARIKGVGTDCLCSLAEIYERAGVVPHIDIPYYPADWHLHNGAERYLEGILQYATEIPGPPEPGDAALFHFGRAFSHGAVVVEWPRVIHAHWAFGKMVWGNATLHPLSGRTVKFFNPFIGAR